MRWAHLAMGMALVACGPNTPPIEGGEAQACEGVSHSALSVVDRKIVGVAAPYPADGTLRANDEALSASQRLRRQVAWTTVAKVLTPVTLADTPPTRTPLPAWQTWYDLDDLRRIFQRIYGDMSPADMQARAHFDPATLDDTFLWNTTAVDELPTWPEDRYLAYLNAIDEASEVAGLGGISRVSYSPAAARHLLQSYPEVLGCRDDGAPPAQAVGPEVVTPIMRTSIVADACAHQTIGSFSITQDESLRAVLEGDDDARVVLRAGDRVCEASTACEIVGPETVEVSVVAGTSPVRGVIALERVSTRPAWAACLDDAFPIDAVVVKADYRRADFEMTMPVYATSSAALEERLSGDVSWSEPDGEADPAPDDIYTLTLPNGAHYRLAALHVMTKELDHWLWTTLWWSSSPSDDFGADRPANIDGVWANYKMCTASAFAERDPLAGGGFDDEHPSLADALSATYAGVDGPSWCSNPYLEEGHGNAGSNCVGCHQHGGTELSSEDVLLFPDHGRTATRNNFPTDYSWATSQGDDLAQLFADVELYHQP